MKSLFKLLLVIFAIQSINAMEQNVDTSNSIVRNEEFEHLGLRAKKNGYIFDLIKKVRLESIKQNVDPAIIKYIYEINPNDSTSQIAQRYFSLVASRFIFSEELAFSLPLMYENEFYYILTGKTHIGSKRIVLDQMTLNSQLDQFKEVFKELESKALENHFHLRTSSKL